jgi:hypothetical protein
LIDVGFEGMPEMFRIIIKNAMKAEWEQYLKENKYERTLCVYNNETTDPNNLVYGAKEKRNVSRRKKHKPTWSRSGI